MAHRERVNPELDAAVLPGRVLAFPADRGRVRMSQCRCPWPVGAGHTCGGSRSHRARPPERPGLQRRGRRGSSERRAPPLPHLGQGPGRAYAQAPPQRAPSGLWQWFVQTGIESRSLLAVVCRQFLFFGENWFRDGDFSWKRPGRRSHECLVFRMCSALGRVACPSVPLVPVCCGLVLRGSAGGRGHVFTKATLVAPSCRTILGAVLPALMPPSPCSLFYPCPLVWAS